MMGLSGCRNLLTTFSISTNSVLSTGRSTQTVCTWGRGWSILVSTTGWIGCEYDLEMISILYYRYLFSVCRRWWSLLFLPSKASNQAMLSCRSSTDLLACPNYLSSRASLSQNMVYFQAREALSWAFSTDNRSNSSFSFPSPTGTLITTSLIISFVTTSFGCIWAFISWFYRSLILSACASILSLISCCPFLSMALRTSNLEIVIFSLEMEWVRSSIYCYLSADSLASWVSISSAYFVFMSWVESYWDWTGTGR